MSSEESGQVRLGQDGEKCDEGTASRIPGQPRAAGQGGLGHAGDAGPAAPAGEGGAAGQRGLGGAGERRN